MGYTGNTVVCSMNYQSVYINNANKTRFICTCISISERWDISEHTILDPLQTLDNSDLYLCENGEVILQRFVCDTRNTCADGSDEVRCGKLKAALLSCLERFCQYLTFHLLFLPYHNKLD